MKRIAQLSMAVFLVAAPFLFYGFAGQFLGILAQVSLDDPEWRWFFVGCAVFVPVYLLAKRILPAVWSYLATLEHEMTHLIVGLLFLKIPVSIRVSAHKGGEVKYVGLGTTGETWVALAPYFFPTVPLAVVLIGWIFGLDGLYVMAVLGWATAFHLVSNWAETSFRQPDLKEAGILKTLLILPVMNLICYGAVFAYVSAGGPGFRGFWVQGAAASLLVAREFWQRLV